MKSLSIAQDYLLCTLSEKGKISSMSTEMPICLVVGGLLDMVLDGCIAINNDKFCVFRPLSDHLLHLQPLYDFIAEKKEVKPEGLVDSYCFSLDSKKLNALLESIGDSLAEAHCVTKEQGGLFGKSTRYLPDANEVDHLIQQIRAEFLEDGELSDEMAGLTVLLERSHQIKRYFSPYEKDQLKQRLQEIRALSAYRLVKQMTDYIDTIIAVIVAT